MGVAQVLVVLDGQLVSVRPAYREGLLRVLQLNHDAVALVGALDDEQN